MFENVAPRSAPEPSSVEAGRRRGYLARHWRGELSLPQSYWLNNVLGSAAALGAMVGLGAGLGKLGLDYGVAAYWVLAWATMIAVVVWQGVGVWRSARRRIAEGGGRGWARAAQAMVVIGILQFLSQLATMGVPSIRAGFAFARWLDENGSWTIRAMRDGAELELSGGIGHGFAADVARALGENPNARLVHVNLSAGGLVEEAKKAGASIRARGADTFTSSACQSACTLVFLGGEERLLKPGARLGFHVESVPGVTGIWARRAGDEQVTHLVSLGVTPEFARRVAKTPQEDMWFPTESELLEGRVITAVTEGGTFAISGFGDLSPSAFETSLEQVRVYRVLKAKYPATFAEVVQTSYEAAQAGKSMDELRAITVPRISSVFSARLPHASDDAVLRFGRLMVAQLAALRAAPGSACLDYTMGRRSDVDPMQYIPLELRTEELEVMADVLDGGAADRRAPDVARLEPLLARAASRGRELVGDDIAAVGSLGDPNVDPHAACRAMWGLYSGAISLPPEDGATLLRMMFAQAER